MTQRRRNAIAAGLRPWLGEEEIAIALGELEGDPVFNLQRFADRIYDRLAPKCARRDFHRSLVQSVFLGAEAPAEGPVAAPGDGAETRVFTGLLGAFLGALAAQRGPAEAEVRAYLRGKLDRFGLGAAAQQSLSAWLGGQGMEPAVPLPREAMRQMINLAYVLACEYLGPVAADRLLSLAVRKAEALPEAQRFPPRGLL